MGRRTEEVGEETLRGIEVLGLVLDPKFKSKISKLSFFAVDLTKFSLFCSGLAVDLSRKPLMSWSKLLRLDCGKVAVFSFLLTFLY